MIVQKYIRRNGNVLILRTLSIAEGKPGMVSCKRPIAIVVLKIAISRNTIAFERYLGERFICSRIVLWHFVAH